MCEHALSGEIMFLYFSIYYLVVRTEKSLVPSSLTSLSINYYYYRAIRKVKSRVLCRTMAIAYVEQSFAGAIAYVEQCFAGAIAYVKNVLQVLLLMLNNVLQVLLLMLNNVLQVLLLM